MAVDFNTDFYIQSKFNQLQEAGRLDEFGLTDVESLKTFFEENGVDAQAHYLNSGMAEGINPSPEFDTNAYLEAKVAELQNAEKYGDTYAGFTVDDVIAAFKSAGVSALEHYNQSGINEGIAPQVPAEATAGAELALTTNTDKLVSPSYELAEGESEDDVVRTTSLDDTITGVASSLSSERTLNADDMIDGADGNNVLSVNMKGNFSGFSDTGGVTNVGNVHLTNEGTIDRSFNATRVDSSNGIDYVVNAGDATVNLEALSSIDTSITLNNQADGTFTAAFAENVADGNSDELQLGLNGVGTVQSDDVSEEAVAITVADVESALVEAAGDNVVDLSAVDATSYAVSGEGSLKVTDLADGLSAFDASALAGDLDLTVDTGTARKNATIAGGDGVDDTVRLSGGANTVQYNMSGIENVVLAGSALTFSAVNASGIETISATEDMGGAAKFSGLGNADLALDVESGFEDVTLDNSGTTTVNVDDSDATSSAPVTLGTGKTVTLTKSTAAVVNVAENVMFDGTLAATQAQSVTLAAAGGFAANAALEAGNATEVVINQVDANSTLDMTAGDAEQLTVNATANLDLSGSTDLTGLQVLNVDTVGYFQAGNLSALAEANLDGTGAVTLGDLGDSGLDAYGITVSAGPLSNVDGNNALTIGTITTDGTDITVDAADVLGDVSLGAIDAGTGNVTVDVSNITGDVTYNGITLGGSLTLNGAELSGNNATVNAEGDSFTGVLNGGIEADEYTVNLASNTTQFNLSGDLGVSDDVLNISLAEQTGSGEVDATINVADVETLNFTMGSDDDDTITLTAASSLLGTTTLTVNNGTLDVSALANADAFSTVTNVEVGSGLKMTAAQFANVKNVKANSSTAKIDVSINSEEEAEQVEETINNLENTSDGKGGNISFGLQVASSVVTNPTAKAAIDRAIKKLQEKGSNVAQEVVEDSGTSTTDSGSIGALFTVPDSDQATVSPNDNVAEEYTLTGGSLDISSLKQESGDATILDLSGATIDGAIKVTVATLETSGNKSDFSGSPANGDRKSDQTIKLPALENIEGDITLENMTIASTTGYSHNPVQNDVVNLAEWNVDEAGLAGLVTTIDVTSGSTEGPGYVNFVIGIDADGDDTADFNLSLDNLVSEGVYGGMLKALDLQAANSLADAEALVNYLSDENTTFGDATVAEEDQVFTDDSFDISSASDEQIADLVGLMVDEGNIVLA
ncbi:hypothetical protein GLV89_13540 [Halomonas alkaliantarctica]|nr:hypothetical protein [Halomonas alkaliantarctica]